MENSFIKTQILLSKAVPAAKRAAKLPISEETVAAREVLELCKGAFLTDPRFCAEGKREDRRITEYYEKLVSEGARVFTAYFRGELVGINVISREKDSSAVRNFFGVTAEKYRGTFAAAALYAGVIVKLYDEGEEILLADISRDNSASLSLHRTLGGEGFSEKE